MKTLAKILLGLFYVTVLGIAYQTLAGDAVPAVAAAQKAAEEFTWSYTTLTTCAVGYLTHVVLLWGEDRKNAPAGTDGKKLSFTAWFVNDWSVPGVGLLGAVIGYILLPSLNAVPVIGPMIGDKITFSALGAYGVGLGGSYLARKLAALVTPAKPPN